MPDPMPALSFDESALVSQIAQWSGLYLPLADARVSLASVLEEKGLVTIDRHQDGVLYVELAAPSTPAPMPTLTVLPKPMPLPERVPNEDLFVAADPRNIQIAELEDRLFALQPLLDQIRRIDMDRISPLEAMTALYTLKRAVQKLDQV